MASTRRAARRAQGNRRFRGFAEIPFPTMAPFSEQDVVIEDSFPAEVNLPRSVRRDVQR